MHRTVTALVVSALAAGAALVMPTAGSAAAKPAPTARPVAQTPNTCVSRHGGDVASPTCFDIDARIASVPKVGGTTTVTVTVHAQKARPHAAVTVDLPPQFVPVRPVPSTRTWDGSGPHRRVTLARLSLPAGQTRTFVIGLRAARPGYGELVASARARVNAWTVDANQARITPTVRADRAGTTAVPAFSAHSTNALRRVGPSPAHAATVTPHATTTCANGVMRYTDQLGAAHGVHNAQVQVTQGSMVLTQGLTGIDGSYVLCWNQTAAASVRVLLTAANDAWSVRDSAETVYTFTTGWRSVAAGSMTDFGISVPSSGNLNRVLHVFQAADDEYQWVYGVFAHPGPPACWSPFEQDCTHPLVLHWDAGYAGGTFYGDKGNVYLEPVAADRPNIVVHEIGHYLMDKLYEENFPNHDNCSPHYLYSAGSPGCGWTEGWADWVAVSIYDSTVWTFQDGGTTDLARTWNGSSGGLVDTAGDAVESHVAMAMRYLSDGVNQPWDQYVSATGKQDNTSWMTIMHEDRPQSFAAAWTDRGQAGYDVGPAALGALYQATIDYGYRNPLGDDAGAAYPQAVPDHHYSFTTSQDYWSVIAVRPDQGTDSLDDVDLTVYDGTDENNLLGFSDAGDDAIDFVGINSNVRPLQTYGARVHQYAGAGKYAIVAAGGTDRVTSGTVDLPFDAAQPLTVLDSYQSAGIPVYLRAVALSGNGTLQLGMLSAGAGIVSRSAATMSDLGLAGDASMTYTPTTTGWQGLVLTRGLFAGQSAAGTVRLYADTTAPTGKITIAAGAATTTSRRVQLTLKATDTNTGVNAAQVSTDGTFDTEPVLTNWSRATAVLTGDNGTKTVWARYRNNAGQWSAPVSDTISLLLPPTVTSFTPKSGATVGGTRVTITGTNLDGASAVSFGGTSASFTVNSSTKITATAPAHSSGYVPVAVTTPAGTVTTGRGLLFHYVVPPSITVLSPSSGPFSGGNEVWITGSDFTGATAVSFGRTAATDMRVYDDNTILVHAPAGPTRGSGQVVVTVSNDGVAGRGAYYSYVAAPTVTGLSPASGSHNGGTVVTVTGTGFLAAQEARVDGVSVPINRIYSDTQVQITMPSHVGGGAYVSIAGPGGISAIGDASRFLYT